MKTVHFALFMLVTSLTLQAQKGDGVQRLHPSKGSQYSYSVKTENTNTTTMMGNENITTLKALMKGTIRTTDAMKDSTVFAVEMRDAVVGVTGMSFFGLPDTTFHFDNLSAAQETVVTAPSGKVLRRDHKKLETPPGGEQMIMRQLSGARNPLHSMFLSYPETALSPGHDWNVTSNDTNDQGMGKVVTNLAMRYTYEGTVDTLGMKCGRISGKSERFVVSGTMKQMGREVNVDGDGIVNIKYLFEISTGLPVTIVTHTLLDQRISIGEGMEIPTSSDITSTIQRMAQ